MTQAERLIFWWKNCYVKTSKVTLPIGITAPLVSQDPLRVYLSWWSSPNLVYAEFTPLDVQTNIPIVYDNTKAREVLFEFTIDKHYKLTQVAWNCLATGADRDFFITEVSYGAS